MASSIRPRNTGVRHRAAIPIARSQEARLYSCERLNQILSDTQILYALYKKHHWLMRGATFAGMGGFSRKRLTPDPARRMVADRIALILIFRQPWTGTTRRYGQLQRSLSKK
jgi:hypothetical protein